MIVCIAEKPSVARDIAQVLGATERHDGYFEGNGYQVTWTFGHLCELKYPEDYYEPWHRWSLAALPMIPPRFGIRLKNDRGVAKQFKVIKSLFEKADSIVNCGDAGQEGELIQRWVLQMSGAKCSVQRLWISSLTEESIREGFGTLKDSSAYQSLYEAGLCRAIGDWLLGMNATRLYTLKFGSHERGAQPLSVGRVQTPTLAMIVNRQNEIDNFVPQPYWVLTTVYRDTTFTATAGNFSEEEKARLALEKIRGKAFTVDKVTCKQGKEAPPRLFDLTSLQVECNRKFSFSAEKTLQIAQSLYEKHVATYPRVDTTYLPDDVFPKCKGILNSLSQYAEFLQPLRGKALKKNRKFFDNSKVTDHHAIIPTGAAATSLTDDEAKVFDLIARHFIAAFWPDCVFSTTTVQGHCDDVKFKATGKQIIEPAWRTVFPKQKQQEEDDDDRKKDIPEAILPDFTEGESGEHKPSVAQKSTQPPKPYTEATLLRAMETAGKSVDDETLRDALKENGIGRPSTRAAIIETLFRRRYIVKQRKSIVPTATGHELIALIHENLLKSAELTGQWEKKLREIERGEYSSQQFVGELKEMVSRIVASVIAEQNTSRVSWTATPAKGKTAKAPARKSKAAATPESKSQGSSVKEGDVCPVCGKGKVIRGKTALGCSRWKEGCNFRQPLES